MRRCSAFIARFFGLAKNWSSCLPEKRAGPSESACMGWTMRRWPGSGCSPLRVLGAPPNGAEEFAASFSMCKDPSPEVRSIHTKEEGGGRIQRYFRPICGNMTNYSISMKRERSFYFNILN